MKLLPPNPHDLSVDYSGRHVLLADDNEINQMVAREILENASFSVTVVANGQEAVDALLAQGSTFDLVLMDIQMPVMGGYATTEIIRGDARFKDLPIIALTAHDMAGEREKSISKGMNEHITKPIDPDVLFKIIANWIKPNEAVQKVGPAKKTGHEDFPHHLPPFDIPAALSRLGGKKDLLFTLLIKFHDLYVDMIPSLRKMLDDGKFEDATRLAHTLRGGAGALEARDVYEICTHLEAALEQNHSDEIPTLVANLEAAMALAIEATASLKP